MEERNAWDHIFTWKLRSYLRHEFFSTKRQGIILQRSHPSSKAIQKRTQAFLSDDGSGGGLSLESPYGRWEVT
uniref:Uncharacterized protein n=1 Tax=Oryza glaberrima TaxID=4538 RepID=A0A679BA52_ORYGL|nr:hypothetical protein [Oryza glaberrima]